MLFRSHDWKSPIRPAFPRRVSGILAVSLVSPVTELSQPAITGFGYYSLFVKTPASWLQMYVDSILSI
jgi:hypothetical protein